MCIPSNIRFFHWPQANLHPSQTVSRSLQPFCGWVHQTDTQNTLYHNVSNNSPHSMPCTRCGLIILVSTLPQKPPWSQQHDQKYSCSLLYSKIVAISSRCILVQVIWQSTEPIAIVVYCANLASSPYKLMMFASGYKLYRKITVDQMALRFAARFVQLTAQ